MRDAIRLILGRAAMALLLTVLTAATAKADAQLSGDGTKETPYQITNADDWYLFATNINNGIDTDAYYELAGNITISDVTALVGNSTNKFMGHFDGKGYKLTLNINSTAENAAPFSVVDGATITDLTVDGTIQSTRKFAAGLVGLAYGTTSITKCTSSVLIISDIDLTTGKRDGDATYAGFVARNMENSTTNFEDCIFNGTIRDIDLDNRKTIKVAGFTGWRAYKINYKNCIQAGTIAVKSNTATFHRGINNTNSTFTNTYYITLSGDEQGTKALTEAPKDKLAKKWTDGETVYYLPESVIEPLATTTYAYTTRAIDVKTTVTFAGKTLTKDTEYDVFYQKKIDDENYEDVAEVKDAGVYRLTMEGINDYAGCYTTEDITVVAIGPTWADLQEELDKGGTVCITQDYTADADDSPLNVSKTVILDLNGFTIDRDLTSAVSNGNVITNTGNLTIIDSSEGQTGSITGGYNYGNGGGIVNKGSLTLKSGNICGNQCLPTSGSFGTGGGIYNEGGRNEFYMEGGSLRNNSANGGGGGIHAKGGKKCIITGGEITGNTSFNKGGGLRLTTEATVSNCVISNNKATGPDNGKGGGIYVEGNVTLKECVISGNEAQVEGGALFSMTSDSTVITAKECTITGNKSKVGGLANLLSGTIYNIDGGNYYDNVSTDGGPNFNVNKGATFELHIEDKANNIMEDLDRCTPSKVILANRKLYRDGDWNTLCLPFNLTIEGSPLDGADARTLASAELSDEGDLSLSFTETGAKELVAGTPYIIKWDTDEALENVEFEGVTISNEHHDFSTEDGRVKFIGTTVFKSFDTTDQSILLLGTNSKLYYPKANASIGACRAYFQIEEVSYNVKNFKMNFTEDTTDIDDVTPTEDTEEMTDDNWYDLNGRNLGGKPTRKGIYVNKGQKVAIK